MHEELNHVSQSYCSSGLKKKIEKAAKEKDCNILFEWCKSMVNHLYWCAASTPDGNGELLLAKWLSLDNHLHNIHRGHSDIYHNCIYHNCGHGRLRGRREKKKKWLEPGKDKLTVVRLCKYQNICIHGCHGCLYGIYMLTGLSIT
jgi:hypothetical protein